MPRLRCRGCGARCPAYGVGMWGKMPRLRLAAQVLLVYIRSNLSEGKHLFLALGFDLFFWPVPEVDAGIVHRGERRERHFMKQGIPHHHRGKMPLPQGEGRGFGTNPRQSAQLETVPTKHGAVMSTYFPNLL